HGGRRKPGGQQRETNAGAAHKDLAHGPISDLNAPLWADQSVRRTPIAHGAKGSFCRPSPGKGGPHPCTFVHASGASSRDTPDPDVAVVRQPREREPA